ncbi:MAG: hypothetical protein QXI17_04270 [Candidatus Bilamarchaeaceae archaeon]
MITLISTTTIISGSLFLITGFYVFLSWKKKKEFLLQVFGIFLLSMGIQMICLTLGLAAFFDNYLMSNICWLIAHIFLIVAMSNLVILPIRIKFPTKEELVRKIGISYLVIGGLILLLNLPRVELFKTPENIINWRVPPMSVAVIVFCASTVSIFSAYVFIAESLKIENKLMKLRSILLALGILVFFIGGPMHNAVTNVRMAILAASLSVLGVFLILAGIYIPKIFEQPLTESFPRTKF